MTDRTERVRLYSQEMISLFSETRSLCGNQREQAQRQFGLMNHNDARITAFSRLEISLNSALILLKFMELSIEYDWFKMHYIDNFNISKNFNHPNEYFIPFSRFSFLLSLWSATESSFKIFNKFLLDKGKVLSINKNSVFYKKLFNLLRKTPSDAIETLDGLRNYRNTIHNYGIFNDPYTDEISIKRDGEIRKYVTGDRVIDLTWGALNDYAEKVVNIFKEIIFDSELTAFKEHILDPLTDARENEREMSKRSD